MLLDKIFGKKKKERISSQMLHEGSIISPIPFRTCHGGSRPTDYSTTREMRECYQKPLEIVQELIDQGLTDLYSDPDMFDTLIDAYFQKCHNSIEKQSNTFLHVIESIRSVEESSLFLGMQETAAMEAAIRSLTADSAQEREVDHYDEIQEK